MDKQSKFFDKNYLTTRLRDFAAIKNKSVWFEIGDSNRSFSKTIYIYLYTSTELKNKNLYRLLNTQLKEQNKTQQDITWRKCQKLLTTITKML